MEENQYGHPVRGKQSIRAGGFLSIFFGIISLGLDITLDTMITRPALGFWIAPIFALIAGTMGAYVAHRYLVTSTSVTSFVAAILCFFGAAASGVYSRLLDGVTSCVNIDNTVRYGRESYYEDAVSCYNETSTEWDCYCYSTENQDCLYLNGLTNCDDLDTYLEILKASVAFDVFLLFSIIFLFAATSTSICCPSFYGYEVDRHPDRPTPATATVQVPTNITPTVIMAPACQVNAPVQLSNVQYFEVSAVPVYEK